MFLPRQESITIEDVDEVIRGHQPDHSSYNITVQPALPKIVILEQPASRALRFRYECEGRSAGSIPGVNSTPANKTYPTIKIANYTGSAVAVVSCVTKDAPFRPHPNNLVGKEGCKKGVCTVVVNNPDMTYSFTSLGIQCVKKKDVEESLQKRNAIKVDPFGTGFSHSSQSGEIELNAVRLCFQVFIKGPDEKYTVPLPPVVSDIIYDKKAMSELSIYKLSHCSAPVSGGTEVIMLCDRISKNDIQIRFFEEKDDELLWEAMADFQPCDVYRMVAVCFRTPRYHNENIKHPVTVNIQLLRPSDGETSQPRQFQLLPLETDPDGLIRKRLKVEGGCLNRFYVEEISPSEAEVESRPVAVPRMVKQAIRGCRPKAFDTESSQVISTVDVSSCSLSQQVKSEAECNIIDTLTTLPTSSTADACTSEMVKTEPLTNTHDFLAIASQWLGDMPMTIDTLVASGGDCFIDEATEKIDSLDLGVDPLELLNVEGCLSETLPMNLSASLFESGNHLELNDSDMQQKIPSS